MKYLSVPNLPEKRVKGVLVSCRIKKESEKKLIELGIEVYKTPDYNKIEYCLIGHPDITIHHLGGCYFAAPPDLCEYYQTILPGDVNIISGASCLQENYPGNTIYNIARIGKYAFHKLQYTDSVISAYFNCNDIKLINVMQAYSKCSVCIVSEHAAITSDIGIYKKIMLCGLDVLLIEPGFFTLAGCDYGFIGGSTGLIDKDLMVVNGRIDKHPDAEKIFKFCKKHNVHILPLNDSNAEDIGSIIPLFY
jgi:hypothetical protein